MRPDHIRPTRWALPRASSRLPAPVLLVELEAAATEVTDSALVRFRMPLPLGGRDTVGEERHIHRDIP